MSDAADTWDLHLSVEALKRIDRVCLAFELRVYENLPDSKLGGIAGGALCCTSPLLLLVGIALLAYGPILVTTRSKKRMP